MTLWRTEFSLLVSGNMLFYYQRQKCPFTLIISLYSEPCQSEISLFSVDRRKWGPLEFGGPSSLWESQERGSRHWFHIFVGLWVPQTCIGMHYLLHVNEDKGSKASKWSFVKGIIMATWSFVMFEWDVCNLSHYSSPLLIQGFVFWNFR